MGPAWSGPAPHPHSVRRSQGPRQATSYAHGVLTVVLISLATYRITRFLVRDTFPPIALLRARFAEKAGHGSSLAYLASCTWCASVYVATAVWGATEYYDSVPLPALTIATASAVSGLLSSWEIFTPDEPEIP